MRTQGQRSQKKEQNRILPLILLLLAGVLVYLATDDSADLPLFGGQKAKQQKVDSGIANQHLSMTSKKMEIDRMRVEIENRALAPKVGDHIWPQAVDTKNYGVDHTPDSGDADTYRDLNRDKKELRYFSPNAQIQADVYGKDKLAEQNAFDKQEYARQFVDNALKNGYQVTLDDELKVISVKKVKKAPAAVEIPTDGSGLE